MSFTKIQLPKKFDQNQLFHGDNLEVMQSLPSDSIDLIYSDPPFFSQRNYTAESQIDKGEIRSFIDTFNTLSDYLEFLSPRLIEMHRLLKSTGSIYIHLDWHASHYVKVMMDQIFNYENFRNEIIWFYTSIGWGKKHFSRKHDNLLYYTKTDNYTFNDKDIRIEISESSKERYKYGINIGKRNKENIDDYRYKPGSYDFSKGKIPEDVWQIPTIQGTSYEFIDYPTQKPEALLERIIKASSNIGDTVADFFGGCFDKETEVLTTEGWKLFSELTGNELICSLNPLDHSIEFVPYTQKIEYIHNGDMYHIHGRSIDLLVTPDHKIYAKDCHRKKFELYTIENFNFYGFNKLNQGIWKSTHIFNKDFLELLGFWYGDGYKTESETRSNRIGFHLKKERKINYLLDLLEILNMEYHIYKYNDGTRITDIKNDILDELAKGDAYTKRVPKFIFNLSSECINSFLKGYQFADACQTKTEMYSCNKELLNDMQILLLLSGSSGILSKRKDRITNIKNRQIKSENNYALTKHELNKELKLYRKNISKIPYNDIVYDVTLTNNHILYVRRNGKPCWSGNSGTTASVCNRLNRRWITCDISQKSIDVIKTRLFGNKSIHDKGYQPTMMMYD